MAQRGADLEQENLSCLICQDLLEDPVTIPCGHSYCKDCIKAHWDEEREERKHSCPQCRKTLKRRPVLMKNTVLAVLVEELKKTELHAAPADRCYAGPEDVACEVCSVGKLKAVKSCLVCRVSFCQEHLQPHFGSAAFKEHRLVDPSKKQENICSRHREVMKMFCRTDQQCICYLCSMDQHKGHDTVSAAAERTESEKELQARIQDRKKAVELLQQEVEAIDRSAGETVEHSEKIFTELIRLLEERRSAVTKQVRSQQQTEGRRVKELQEKLQQEIKELKRRDKDLKKLPYTEDHNQFLLSCPSALGESTHSSGPLSSFQDLTAAVSELRDRLQEVLKETWTDVSQAEADVSPAGREPETRAQFLRYSREITLDPNTAHAQLTLSEGGRRATATSQKQSYPSHPDRFTSWRQVLSREGLTGRCYWEVEWRGRAVYVAVTYRNVGGASDETKLGFDGRSWVLRCFQNSYTFLSNNTTTAVSGPPSSRVGVYLDHGAGVLAFYSVSETMTLLHRVQTAFTQPLHAGLWFYHYGDAAEFCKRD